METFLARLRWRKENRFVFFDGTRSGRPRASPGNPTCRSLSVGSPATSTGGRSGNGGGGSSSDTTLCRNCSSVGDRTGFCGAGEFALAAFSCRCFLTFLYVKYSNILIDGDTRWIE